MIEVEVPDGIVEFPDEMQPEQIQSVLQKRFPKPQPSGDTTAEGLPRFQTPKGLAAPTEEEMREPAVSPLDTLTTSPIKYLPPAAQNVARKVIGTLGGGVIGAAGEALSTLAPQTRIGQIGKGISEAQTDNAEFFTSPLGVATLGIGGLPAIAQRAAALGFAAQMASQVPDLSRQLGEELGKPEDQRDYQKIAKLVTQGATTIGFTAAAGTHALAPRRPPITPPPDVPQPITPPPELRPTVSPEGYTVLGEGRFESETRPPPEAINVSRFEVGGKVRYTFRLPPKTVSETTPPVPPAEMPATPTESGFYPAIRLVGGEVVVGEAGQTHPDIIAENKLTAKDIDQRGFVNKEGVFSDREQTAAVTGLPTEQEPQRQHSTDLPEAEKGEPSAETIRRDKGQLPPEGQEPQGSEAPRSDDLQRTTPGPPNEPSPQEGQAPSEVVLKPAATAIAELKRELSKQQKALDKNINKMGSMVPPPIVSEITRKIATRMAKIQDKIDALEKQSTPEPKSPTAKIQQEVQAVAKTEGQRSAKEIIARGELRDNPSKDNAQVRSEWRARKLKPDEFYKVASEDERMKYDPKNTWVVEQRRVDIENEKETPSEWSYPVLGKSKAEAIRNVGSTDFYKAESLDQTHATETERLNRLNQLSSERFALENQLKAPDRYTKSPLDEEYQRRYEDELRKRRLTKKAERGEVKPEIIEQIAAPLREERMKKRREIEAKIEQLHKQEAQLKSGKPLPPSQPTAEARPITEEGAMQSGPALGIDEFVKKDVAPFLKKGVDAGRALVDIMVDTFSPGSRTSSRDVDVLFASKGYKEKVITRAADALTKSGDILDKLPESEQIAFVDRVKRGQRQPTPELQRAADLMRKWDDRLFAMVRRYRPDLPYLENHNRVLWKVIPGSPQAKGASVTAVRSRRPWQGSKGFLKRHVLDDMSTGIAKGGIPVTYNPIDMFLLHAEDAMKFVAANRAWEGLKKTGSVEWVKTGQRPPLDYVRISDSIAKPYFKTPQGLLAKAGEWYVEPGAARMIENYLSRDYIRTGKFGPVGRAMLALKNATTAIELGLSPFHAVFESNEVMGSSIGLGLAKLASGKLSGIKDILGAPFSPKTTSRLGKLGIQYAKNPTEFARVYPDAYKWFTTKYPEAGKLIDDLFAGGGQPGMNEDYRVRGIQGFKKAVAEGNYPGAILRTFPALNELAMKPLFQTYIPRLKVGMFLREYSFELERNAKQLADGKITRGELARKTWAFNEDRFGELNFDNLYWDRTFKSAMQLLFRSVTWKIGNLRGFGKAARDIWTEGLKPLTQGEKPRVTLPMAWLGGMAFVTAVQASIISKVATGKYPWELAKDNIDFLRNLVFPRIDPDDERQRVSIPTYWRDLVHLAHSPVGYVGSSMTGEWRRLYDDLVNKDFYKHPIYNPNDPIQKKAVAALEHLIPLPFGASSFVGATKEGVGPARASAGFLGFTKAPSYISPPTAQTQVRDLALKWKTESKIPKLVNEAQRQATEQFEPSDYVPLRQALKNRNYEAARKALDNLLEQGHSTANIAQTMRPLNREGKPKPFTGSQLQEKYFLQSLTPKEKELYREAIRERIETYRRFREMLTQPK